MTLHKIDRERLAEALRLLESGTTEEWDKFREETGTIPHVYRRKAAGRAVRVKTVGPAL